MPNVIHHQRLPQGGQVSIERLFEEIRNHMPEEWQATTVTSPHPSRGLSARLKNISFARCTRADIHHIVGDVHYLAFGIPGDRLVLTIHDCAVLNRLKGWRREVFRQLWFVHPMRRAAVVTTISETTKMELRRWVGSLADRIVVVPNCVRSEFQNSPKPFAAELPIALQVGTGWNKNVERVAAALTRTPCSLEIVGILSDTQRNTLEGTGVPYRELGRVNDEELVEAYRRCDFVIFASLYEGFGLPILEAQATGRPVITSNCSSMPEAAGDGALFVDPESVESINRAVLSLLGDQELRESLKEKGTANVSRFQASVVAASYVGVYENVIRSGQGSF